MKRIMQVLALMIIGILGVTATAWSADSYLAHRRQPPDTNIMAADALVGRPLGLGMTILGTGVFIATLPFTAGTGSTGDAARGLITEPAQWTFTRPLGESGKKKTSGFILP